jgi:hypothetical protein
MGRLKGALGSSAILLVASLANPPALGAQAAVALECSRADVPVERQLRQLYLDLLGRPPTIEEYRAQAAKGVIDDADIDELMTREDFFLRMKSYHRALLRANVSASLPTNNDTRLQTSGDGAKPIETRGNFSAALRGRNGQGCDHFIPQDDCKNAALQQDPHAEGAASAKVCRDKQGVPLPVSFDYDNTIYACSALTGATSCNDAVSKGLLEAKYLYFCDMRRATSGLAPFKCLPDPSKPATAALSVETMDADNHVIALRHPARLLSARGLGERRRALLGYQRCHAGRGLRDRSAGAGCQSCHADLVRGLGLSRRPQLRLRAELSTLRSGRPVGVQRTRRGDQRGAAADRRRGVAPR